MKSSIRATLLASALLSAATIPALSQTSQAPAGGSTRAQTEARDTDDDDGMDLGWLGLLGLAGLYGLTGRKRVDHVASTTTNRH
jgi:hypothetical protein